MTSAQVAAHVAAETVQAQATSFGTLVIIVATHVSFVENVEHNVVEATHVASQVQSEAVTAAAPSQVFTSVASEQAGSVQVG